MLEHVDVIPNLVISRPWIYYAQFSNNVKYLNTFSVIFNQKKKYSCIRKQKEKNKLTNYIMLRLFLPCPAIVKQIF